MTRLLRHAAATLLSLGAFALPAAAMPEGLALYSLLDRVREAGIEPRVEECPARVFGFLVPTERRLVVCNYAVERNAVYYTFTHEVVHLVQHCAAVADGVAETTLADSMLRNGATIGAVNTWRGEAYQALDLDKLSAVFASSRGDQKRAEIEMEAFYLQDDILAVAKLFDRHCGSRLLYAGGRP